RRPGPPRRRERGGGRRRSLPMSARTAAGVASAVAVLVLLVVVITTVSGMLDGADDGDGEGTGATSTVPPASAPPPFCRVFGVFGDFDDWAEYSVAARLERGVDGFADEASQARLGVVAIAQTNDVDAGPAEPLAEWLAQ